MRLMASFAAVGLLTALFTDAARTNSGSMGPSGEWMLQWAQDVTVGGWSVLVCTFDRPEPIRGAVVTVYFREAPKPLVHYRGTEVDAMINMAEIRFSPSGSANWTISRITGGFSTTVNATTGAGSCVKGSGPKF